tara:strand:+ start:126 stop:956 length:831 start_codon:yes stop_codon:yes gene_type:complete
MDQTRVQIYSDSLEEYQSKLKGSLKENLSSFDPANAKSCASHVTPFGISYVAGIPLFRTHESQRDYRDTIQELESNLPGQYFNDILHSHISLAIAIRNSPRDSQAFNSNGRLIPGYTPLGNKKDFYRDYLEILNSVDFEPFSLSVEGFFPGGIMLWRPQDNPEELFNIRRQLAEGLVKKQEQNRDFHFDTNPQGQPDTNTIIHTTFLRPYDLNSFKGNFSRYNSTIEKINERIENRELFKDHIQIEEIAFIEPNVGPEISPEAYYTDEVIEIKKAK